jgi:hypothetical protein
MVVSMAEFYIFLSRSLSSSCFSKLSDVARHHGFDRLCLYLFFQFSVTCDVSAKRSESHDLINASTSSLQRFSSLTITESIRTCAGDLRILLSST